MDAEMIALAKAFSSGAGSGSDGLGVPVPADGDVGKVPVVQDDLTYGLQTMTVEIPSGGGSISLPLLYDLTTSEEVGWIDTGDNAFLAKNFLFVELISIATATNESDESGSASMYPLRKGERQYPWNNEAVARQISALMPKTYTKVFRAFCFRGDGGHWTSITSIRNDVNTGSTTPAMVSMRHEGTSDQPMRGLIIGNAFANRTNVLGVGSRLRVWGI